MASANDPSADIGLSYEEQERRAFNRAFRELAFSWYWDMAAYRALLNIGDTRQRLRHYLTAEHPAILEAYPLEFLVNLVCATQQRLMSDSFPATTKPLHGWASEMHSTESIA